MSFGLVEARMRAVLSRGEQDTTFAANDGLARLPAITAPTDIDRMAFVFFIVVSAPSLPITVLIGNSGVIPAFDRHREPSIRTASETFHPPFAFIPSQGRCDVPSAFSSPSRGTHQSP